jgi:uncharacterized protein YndB with AHSA1/START domain
MEMRITLKLGAVFLALAPRWAMPAVVDASADGFTVRTTLAIRAAPAEVYRRLVRNVGDWWDPSHTFSGNAHNLSIEEKAAGCFCEKLPDGGGVRHMEVVYFAPGKTLRLSGALGPLQSIAAAGGMTIQLSAADGGTKLEVTYAVAGYVPAGMNTWAAPVDEVIEEQFGRLKKYVETGDPGHK